MMRRHVDLRIHFLGDDQVQRTGHAAAGNDHLSEFRALHQGIVIVHGESAGRFAFAGTGVTLDAVIIENGLYVCRETDLAFAATEGAASQRGSN